MKKRYSKFIRPLKFLIDIVIINSIIYFIYDEDFLNVSFLSYITLFWIIISYLLGFYNVYRYTNFYTIFSLLFKQFSVFVLGYFAYFGLFREGVVVNNQLLILLLITLSITVAKFLWKYLLNKYRALGNNFRTTIVVGHDDAAKKIIKVFQSKSNLGYKFLGYFSNKSYKNDKFLGKLDNIKTYVNTNEVDEIYASVASLSKSQIRELNKFSLEKGISLKLIPETSEFYSKNQMLEYYDDTIAIINVKKLPFEFAENFYVKRLFDIFFSIFIIIFLMSWLTPILWIIVKLESKGPLIFKQVREGLNGDQFTCYKFRSMKINRFSDKVHATKNDSRVTKVGAFMRRTSIDELPQFYNVLLGNMSVVGPRPHLESLSLEYQKDVEDYLKRHIVKPGITGLAQVSGFRGEIRKKSDIKNRIKLDIFYIENWSFFLDLKIIIKTVLNVFEGDENAY